MSSVIRLSDLPVGAEAKVLGFDSQCQQAGRLREMGLLPGTRVKLVRWAPLGDPLEIKIRGYHLSLRRHEAALVEVARCSEGS